MARVARAGAAGGIVARSGRGADRDGDDGRRGSEAQKLRRDALHLHREQVAS
jgi:hypothetical protein